MWFEFLMQIPFVNIAIVITPRNFLLNQHFDHHSSRNLKKTLWRTHEHLKLTIHFSKGDSDESNQTAPQLSCLVFDRSSTCCQSWKDSQTSWEIQETEEITTTSWRGLQCWNILKHVMNFSRFVTKMAWFQIPAKSKSVQNPVSPTSSPIWENKISGKHPEESLSWQ